MAVRCPECQTENTSDSQFCKKCATPLPSSEEISVTKTLETSVKGLTRGTTFAGRYEIIEELGEGGMGKIYRVKDKKLDEEIALKLLKPEIAADKGIIERFKNELKLARKIAHRNVCKMYDLDEEEETPYITMEYVDGEDLKSYIRQKGKLKKDEAIPIAKQVCEGLAEAHELGVVHRDLKPQNIMIDEKGHAKIMDFGIARSVEAPRVTQTGMMIGTPDYISPEQAEGEEADQRSDIYALGVILYEMVTGRVPFKGDTALSVALKHKAQIPRDPRKINPEVSENLSRLILICMEKERQRRYQTAEALLSDLRNIEEGFSLGTKIKPRRATFVAALIRKKLFIPALVVGAAIIAVVVWQLLPKAPSKISIAVLPFEDLSAQKDQEYICDGLAEELINRLTKVEDLSVSARTSSFSFKGKELSIQEIGEKLNVDNILEGSLQKAGKKLRIAVRLVNAADGYPIWTERYERDEVYIFDLQDEISLEIVDNLKIKLLGEQKAKLVDRHTMNPEAYDLYLKGLYHYNKITTEGMKKANEYFQRAIGIDPEFAQAYALLGDTYSYFGFAGVMPLEEAKSKATAVTKKALEIDDTVSEAYFTLSTLRFFMDWDWEGSLREINRAIEFNPTNSLFHGEYAYYLSSMGRFEEAIAEAKSAIQLDPFSYPSNRILVSVYKRARQYDQAKAQCQHILELGLDDARAYGELAGIYELMGRYEDAIKARQKSWTLLEVPPPEKIPVWVEELERAYIESGPRGYWKWYLDRLKGQYDRAPLATAKYYAQLGEKDQAFAWLEKAYEKHAPSMVTLKVDPRLDPLRSDPRFQDLLRRMNFPD